MTNILQTEPYTILASVYQAAGLASYSEQLAPRLLELAFELNWTGRSLLDLACGTGDAAVWFGSHGFSVLGIDASEAMLRFARSRAEASNLDADFSVSDIRTFKPEKTVELVTCIGGSLNYLPSIRDIETVFRIARAALLPGKLFFFDLYTIAGLAHSGDRVAFDDKSNVALITRDNFSFESLTLSREYLIFHSNRNVGDKATWMRADETHTLRGYPIQAVSKLLTQAGFRLLRTMNTNLEPVENQSGVDMLIFAAMREN